MQYIILDLEFNQGFDFKNNKTLNLIPACRFEIIQIGAVKLDENYNIIGKISLYIKPNLYEEIHPYVEKITGLTKEFLKDKPSFKEVFLQFNDFIDFKEDSVFVVWGGSDLRALYRNLSYYNILKGDLILKYIDIQKIASEHLKFRKGTAVGLKTAIEHFDLPSYGEFHDALNDAMYTAQIFKMLILKEKSFNLKIFNSKNIPQKK